MRRPPPRRTKNNAPISCISRKIRKDIQMLLVVVMAVCILVYGLILMRAQQEQQQQQQQQQTPQQVDAALAATTTSKKESHLAVTATPQQQQPRLTTRQRLRDMSSVDYMACCGAGHRLSKLSDASYAAQKLKFALRSFWGYCDTTEVYHYLFGPQPSSEIRNVVQDVGRFVRINNDVPGFVKFLRNGTTSAQQQGDDDGYCPCDMDKVQHDVQFYSSLRNRFFARKKVTQFRKKHFDDPNNATIIVGMHIRGGNGEPGDFADRGRAIRDEDAWLKNVAERLVEERQRQDWGPQVKLFLATDTPSLIPKLKELLGKQNIPLLHVDQVRPEEGKGVLFGERGKVVNTGTQCRQGWMYTFMDMILLSHADVVVAARPSSFTQSLPMSLVLATPPKSRRNTFLQPFCEMNPNATEMRCFANMSDWCCRGTTDFALSSIKQKYEYLRMPQLPLNTTRHYKIQPRPAGGCVPRPEGWKQPCLPYDFSEHRIVPRKREKPQKLQR